jgi:hypothetical protein
MVWDLLDKELWYQIEENLGEITDFEIKENDIHYKSNGVSKIIYKTNDDMKLFVQSFMYCMEQFNPIRKYKPVS